MSEPRNISEKLKQVVDELDLDRHANDLVIQAEGMFVAARDKVATLAAERGDEVERLLDKVSTTIEERTEGRYASELGKIRDTVTSGLTRLAEHRPVDPGPSDPGVADPDPVWPVDEIDPPHAG